ncbi:MAG: alpha-L-fucosidase [Planctomycetota bacterium]
MTNMKKIKMCIITVMALTGLVFGAVNANQNEDYLKASPELIQQWRQLKFGLFVHWGPSSLLGKEINWSRAVQRRGTKGTGDVPVEVYDNLYRSFYPAAFDADQWVQIAKSAGMKYIVFTTKHHDGFCMFDSALTDYKITNLPYASDILKKLADACHRGQIKFGIYYSQPDLHHPDFKTENHARYIEYLHGQLRELCGNYGKVNMIFFDGLGAKSKDWDSGKLFKMIRQLQPDIVINNRAGLPGDYDTPEQKIGEFQRDRPWETCMTIAEKWFWRTEDRIKPLSVCLRSLVATAGGDGNFLFNVGPMPNGQIEPGQVQVLREMGKWVDKYGNTIYGTRGGPFKSGTWGTSTHSGRIIYLHFFNFYGSSFRLPPIPAKITGWTVLTGGQAEIEQLPDGIVVTVPPQYRKEIDTIVALELATEAGRIEPVSVSSGSLAHNGTALASSVYRDRASNAADKAFDEKASTHWRSNTTSGWLQIKLEKSQKVATAVIQQGSDYFGAEEYELLYMQGGQWKSLVKGTMLGQLNVFNFEPVTAQKFRLIVSRKDRQIMIREFQLFGQESE